MRGTVVWGIGLLLSGPVMAEVPPEVQALAEATCAADEFCEMTTVQMAPGGEMGFLWLEGVMDCGTLGCPTFVVAAQDGQWRARDAVVVTHPLSVRWRAGGNLVFDGGLTTAEGKPRCRRVWHWSGKELTVTDAWERVGDCVAE